MNQPAASPGPRRNHPVISLTIARAKEFLREPEAIFWSYVFPLVLALALGAAFRNRPAESFHVAVEEGDRAAAVRDSLQSDPRFRASVCPSAKCHLDLRTGRVDLIVSLGGGNAAQYQYAYDSTRAESVLARDAADDLLQRKAGRKDVLVTRDSTVQEPGSRYVDFLVPGLLGMGMLGGGLWGVGFAIVDMRIRKLLKRYLGTPMRKTHFLTALILSRLLFTLPETLLVLLFTRLLFGVTSQGGYLAVLVLVVLGALEFAGIGLLLASRARTIETVSGLMNAAMLPMWVGSGIFFTTERFPDSVQPLLFLLPLTPLIHALRCVMLEGTSLLALGGDLALIVLWGIVSYGLALKWFRWS